MTPTNTAPTDERLDKVMAIVRRHALDLPDEIRDMEAQMKHLTRSDKGLLETMRRMAAMDVKRLECTEKQVQSRPAC